MDVDLRNIAQIIEDLFYQFLVWMAMFPKTQLRAFFNPVWAQRYVTEEFQKEPQERFNNFLNPYIHWFLSALILIWAFYTTGDQEMTIVEFIILLITFAVFPTVFAVIMLRARGITLNQVEFRRPLYVQMLVFGVFQAGFGVASAALLFVSNSSLITNPGTDFLSSMATLVSALGVLGLFVIPPVWLIIAEIIVIYKEVGRGILIGLAWTFISFVLLTPLLAFIIYFAPDVSLFAHLVKLTQ
jgi:membrane-bound ClpP family serine protease